MENYKYILTYVNDDKTYTHEFNADIDMSDLKLELMYFLRGCSWSEAQTAFLDEDPEEAVRSAVMAEQYDRIAELIKQARDQEWSAKTILEELESTYIC